MYEVLVDTPAAKEFKKLEQSTKETILEVLNGKFRKNPYSSDLNVKKLRKPLSGYRLRIGDYRILFTITEKLIKIYAIRHRKDAYK